MIRKFFAVLLMFAFWSSANAQTAGAYSGLAAINKIILGTPGIGAISTAGSTSVTASAIETASLANGMRIPIATSATAAIAASRMAGIAGAAMKIGTGIGLASLVLPIIWDNSGYKICPPPEFICKATTTPKQSPGGWHYQGASVYFTSPSSACDSKGYIAGPVDSGGTHATCLAKVGTVGCTAGGCLMHNVYSEVTPSCQNGDALTPQGTCRSPTLVEPITQPQLVQAITDAMNASAANQQKMYDAMRNTSTPVVTGTDTVVVTAPAVTTPPMTKTEQVANPDGTTSTKVTTATTTVTPAVTGTGINTTNITYPSVTTTTTSITNNTTNITTTTTTTETETARPDAPTVQVPSAPTAPTQFPTDYNREVTQQEIAAELKAAGAPTMPDQGPVVQAKADEEAARVKALQDAAVADKVASQAMWWTWIWNAPAGTCAPFAGTVHGYAINWDFCDWFANFRDILGWLMGMATCWSIYCTAFKVNGGDS